MSRETLQLVERRMRRVRLPRTDVDFLLEHARHLVEVVPGFKRGLYRTTPRGFVGWFDSPNRRFAIAPKIPWPNVRMLLGLSRAEHATATVAEPPDGLLSVLARELVAELRVVTELGLVAGYHEREMVSAFLRGKLRVNDQIHDVAARAFPDRFHITESVLDLDMPWNRIPRAICEHLLANPTLNENTRIELRYAALSLDSVPVSTITDADFAEAEAEPRAAHYRRLLELCRLIHDGFAAASLPEAGSGAFLIDLGRAFEKWLTRGLATELAGSQWRVQEQPEFPVGPTVLQPDIVLCKPQKNLTPQLPSLRGKGETELGVAPPALGEGLGRGSVVLDAKWKAPGSAPDATDLHQILAYAAVTGAKHVGLVYPGRRFGRCTFAVPGSDIAVSLLRVQVVGTAAECQRSLRTLARFLRWKIWQGKV